MANPTIKIHDLATGEEIIREMDADELKQWEIDKANAEEIELQEAQKELAKEALLTKLGITEDEARLLLS